MTLNYLGELSYISTKYFQTPKMLGLGWREGGEAEPARQKKGWGEFLVTVCLNEVYMLTFSN